MFDLIDFSFVIARSSRSVPESITSHHKHHTYVYMRNIIIATSCFVCSIQNLRVIRVVVKCRECCFVCAWKIEKCHVPRGEVFATSRLFDEQFKAHALLLQFTVFALFSLRHHSHCRWTIDFVRDFKYRMGKNTRHDWITYGWFKCNFKCTRTWFAFHKYAKWREDESRV